MSTPADCLRATCAIQLAPVKYLNLDGSGPQPFKNVLKWMLSRKADKRPFDTPRVAPSLRDGSVTWVGHASWLVQLCGKNLLIDPIWSRAISGVIRRNVEPGIRFEDLPRIDAVLVTHNHRDHMDVPTLRRFASSVGIAPLGVTLPTAEQRPLDWWQTTTIGDVSVQLVPSQHWSRRSLADANASLWGGFVIKGGGASVYHSGDTAYFDGFKTIADRAGPIDVALLPIGAYAPEWFMRKQHMGPADALQAFRDLRAQRMLAMHWGTFQLTDEWLGEPPIKLRALLAPTDTDRVLIPAIGETVSLRQAALLQERSVSQRL